jgi:hypothetical protein
MPILASVTQTADTSSAAAAAVVGCVAKERSARVRRSPVRIGRKWRDGWMNVANGYLESAITVLIPMLIRIHIRD